MIKLMKQGVILDAQEPDGFRPEGEGITFHFKEGPSVYVTNEMFDRMQKTFEHQRATNQVLTCPLCDSTNVKPYGRPGWFRCNNCQGMCEEEIRRPFPVTKKDLADNIRETIRSSQASGVPEDGLITILAQWVTGLLENAFLVK